jgi:uncharacterized membrane protein
MNLHMLSGPDATPAYPVVRKVGSADLKDALTKRVNDFLPILDSLTEPLSIVLLGIIYPIICLYLIGSRKKSR